MPSSGEAPSLTLIVETPNGSYIRIVPDASPLVAGIERGVAAENATRSAVARWGLPDFVYRPVLRQTGSGARELGDGILLVGRRAVVVQVKSRNLPEGERNKEDNWVVKNSNKAFKQARGTVRLLRSAPTTLVNLRGREVTVDGNDFDWLSAIIIDHLDCPDNLTISNPFSDLPAVALTRRDWEFLFTQLRSTHAVVDYLFRVASLDPVPLNREPIRYYELAQADEDATPEEIAPEIIGKGVRVSVPLLPKEPVGHDDLRMYMILRIIMEDIATSPLPEGAAEADRVRALAEIDQLPVQHRTELARAMFSMMREVLAAPDDHIMWRSRSFRFPPGKPHPIFATCNKFNEAVRYGFSSLVMLRHHQFGTETGTLDNLVSVGVLLTPRHDGLRPWDTTLVRVTGRIDFEPGELERIEELWAGARIVSSSTKPRKRVCKVRRPSKSGRKGRRKRR